MDEFIVIKFVHGSTGYKVTGTRVWTLLSFLEMVINTNGRISNWETFGICRINNIPIAGETCWRLRQLSELAFNEIFSSSGLSMHPGVQKLYLGGYFLSADSKKICRNNFG